MNLARAYSLLISVDAILPGPYRRRLEDVIHAQTRRAIADADPGISSHDWSNILTGDPLTILHFIDLCGHHARIHANNALSVSCARGINAKWLRHAGPTYCSHCDSRGQLCVNHPEFDYAAKYCLVTTFLLPRDICHVMGKFLYALKKAHCFFTMGDILAEEMTRDELVEFIAAGHGRDRLNRMLAGLCARGMQEGCQSLIIAGADMCDYCERADLIRHPQFDHRAKMIIFLHVDLLEDVRRMIALTYFRETKNESPVTHNVNDGPTALRSREVGIRI